MFISAFLIDAHPIFIILYVIMNFFILIFGNHVISALDTIYDMAQFSTEVAYLPFVDALRIYYGEIIIGLMIISGIIIYGKIRFFGMGGGR